MGKFFFSVIVTMLLMIGASGAALAETSTDSLITRNFVNRNKQTASVDSSSFSVKFSLGGVVGVAFGEQENNGYTGSWTIYNLINPTFDIRCLFPMENKLQFGFGGDIGLYLYGLWFSNDFDYITDIVRGESNLHVFLVGATLAPYGIIGYNHLFLHAGYDFFLGALYLSPCFVINDHLMMSIPMSLFGGNKLGIYSFLMNRREGFEDARQKIFHIGISFQYILKSKNG